MAYGKLTVEYEMLGSLTVSTSCVNRPLPLLSTVVENVLAIVSINDDPTEWFGKVRFDEIFGRPLRRSPGRCQPHRSKPCPGNTDSSTGVSAKTAAIRHWRAMHIRLTSATE